MVDGFYEFIGQSDLGAEGKVILLRFGRPQITQIIIVQHPVMWDAGPVSPILKTRSMAGMPTWPGGLPFRFPIFVLTSETHVARLVTCMPGGASLVNRQAPPGN